VGEPVLAGIRQKRRRWNMKKLDEDILRAFFRYQEAQRQRLRMERLLHPEKFDWKKRGGPPPMTEVKRMRIGELAELGFDEEFYQRMLREEARAERDLCDLAELHPLWPHFSLIKRLRTPLTVGKYVARGGDIARCDTVSAYWKGLGLSVNPDGSVPRKSRGRAG